MFGNTNKKVGDIDKTVNNKIEDGKNMPANGPDLNLGNQENLINADLLNISNEYNNQIIEGDEPENETDESADEAEILFSESRKYLIERGYLKGDEAPDVMNDSFYGQLPGLGQTAKKDLFDDIDADYSSAYEMSEIVFGKDHCNFFCSLREEPAMELRSYLTLKGWKFRGLKWTLSILCCK